MPRPLTRPPASSPGPRPTHSPPGRIALYASLLLVGAAAPAACAQAGKLFWTEQSNGRVRTSDTNGVGPTNLDGAARSPHAVDADGAARQAFFLEAGTGDIRRVNFDGTGLQTIVAGSAANSLGIAVDPTAQKVWWSDWNTGDIKNANYDGTGVQTVFSVQGGIGGLDIDPAGGHIYIAATGSILRANLNGSGLSTFYTTPYGDLLDVALDTVNQKVYWTDNRNHKVQQADFTGANVKDILSTGLSIPIGIDVLPSLKEIYIANKGGGDIVSADLNGNNPQTIYSWPNSAWGLAAVVPAPGTLALLGLGAALAGRRRR